MKKIKNKKILTGFCIVFILIIVLFLFTVYNHNKKSNMDLELLNNHIILEYGEKYEIKVDKLINLNKFKNIDLNQLKISSDIKYNEENENIKVGIYQISLQYKKQTLTQLLEVKDTTSPTVETKDIHIENGTDLKQFDFKPYITAKDLSDIQEYQIDVSNVNVNVAGQYTVMYKCQ